MQKIILRTGKRDRDFKLFTADLYMNWLVPYFREHGFVCHLIFNRDFDNYTIDIDFDVTHGSSLEFLRFASDLTNHIIGEAYVDQFVFCCD